MATAWPPPSPAAETIRLPFAVAALDPALSAMHPRNRGLLGARTLGIEVTVPELAAGCGLGNIDPQHHPAALRAHAAIEAACTAPLPPPGSVLVTVRPDADSLGAMAVLALRAADIDLLPAIRGRIARIAAADGFRQPPWAAWRPAHPPLEGAVPWQRLLEHAPAAPAIAIAAAADRQLPERVHALALWLLRGARPAWARGGPVPRLAGLAAAWNTGRIRVEPVVPGRLALLRSAVPGALRLAYRWAPVVVAESAPARPARVTIAQFEPGWCDMAGLAAALSDLEPGWGGTAAILGAPQGQGTRLPLPRLLALVRAHLRRPPILAASQLCSPATGGARLAMGRA